LGFQRREQFTNFLWIVDHYLHSVATFELGWPNHE
jgi:hypothetical protein